jgi:hypothetical protein
MNVKTHVKAGNVQQQVALIQLLQAQGASGKDAL